MSFFLPFFCLFCFCCFWASTCIIIFRVHSSGKMKKRYGFLQESQLWYFCFFTFLFGWVPALVSGNLSTRQTAHTVCFLLFFFFPSLWQSSRYRFASRLLPNCPSAVGNFTWKRHGSHFSCNVSLSDHDLGRSLSLLCLLAGAGLLFMRYCMGKIHRPPIFLGPLAAGS